MAKLSPMMQQYMQLKEQYKDVLLFFRLGDFYEMFFDDAILASRELELTLTGRDCGLAERAPMCGVPFHAVDTYVNRLLEKGYKVAICEQLVDPKEAVGLVDRDVVRIITPGTVIESSILDEKKNNYLMTLFLSGDTLGMAYTDVSTGDFLCTEFSHTVNHGLLLDELVRIEPSEVLVNSEMLLYLEQHEPLKKTLGQTVSAYADDRFQSQGGDPALFADIEEKPCAKCASTALLSYLRDTQKNALLHINRISYYQANQYMIIDASARSSLELTETMRSKNRKGSLLWQMDHTLTAMGGRTFRDWLERPLQHREDIDRRLDAVTALREKLLVMDSLSEHLKNVRDLERLAARISYKALNARDCLSISQSLEELPEVRRVAGALEAPLLREICGQLDPLEDVYQLLSSSIGDNPPIGIKEGGIIREGYSTQLDELRHASTSARDIISQMEASEREATGIKNLKIGFNKVFGYYIEVTRSFLEQIPYRYIRKQTLANAERFITPELKELEDTVLHAEERSIRLEYDLFCQIRDALEGQVKRLQNTARAVAQLDCLLSLARLSLKNNYVRPAITDTEELHIVGGRHPVVENSLTNELFVPNNTTLDTDANRFLIITGPNMAGKSTYLRQVALIAIMAHMGSYVPAAQATVGMIDRVFTRVGASDDLYMGSSTFMVEMSEVARILEQATSKSLIVLDEIGRGTSTYDGLSIAWAVVEYIADKSHMGAKTLFATHYHELTELEDKIPGVKNYCISVREQGDQVYFLRKIIRGGADKSFGIHVAALAGLPDGAVSRAKEILQQLEDTEAAREKRVSQPKFAEPEGRQLSLIDTLPYQDILDEIEHTDLNSLTPIEALFLLNKLKDKMTK
ncbi:MAG: DNA mismatch repair protein MutS [Eubacteriales bacterium]|nr:DNA mismatch repair protein MutS [Eubacteriales bacterium]